MEKLLRLYTRVGLLLTPLMVIPFLVDPVGNGKNWWLLIGGVVGMVLWIGQMIVAKKTKIYWSTPFLLLAALTVWGGISWWRLTAGQQAAAFAYPIGISTLLGLLMWMWLFLQVESTAERQIQLKFLTAGAMIAVLISLGLFLVPEKQFPLLIPKTNTLLSIDQYWSITGSLLAEVTMVLFLLFVWVKKLIKAAEKQEGLMTAAVVTGVLALGTVIDLYRMVKMGWSGLDYVTSWQIAAEALKRSPLWGVGIGGFLRAFTLLRPNTFNTTALWSTSFSLSGSGFLQVWTDLGLIGAGLMVWLVLAMGKYIKKGFYFWTSLFLLAALLLLPLQLTTLAVAVWVASTYLFEKKEGSLMMKVGESGVNAMPYVVAVVVVVAGGFLLFKSATAVEAEVLIKESLVAAAKNDGTTTYNLERQAVTKAANMADYHRLFSQTNMAMAQALMQNKELSDDDKQKISVLLQQSVSEGKTAVGLDTINAGYWYSLAQLYRNLVGVVDGAADWSYEAYQQAVALDPANPVYKLDLGGLLYAANRYDEADRMFEEAVTSKQDYANAWYNWAYSAKKSNKLSEAVSRLTQALTLVSATSGDYDTASKELASWKEELDAATKKAAQQNNAAAQATVTPTPSPETLKTAQPLPTGTKEERVNVPASDLEPPAAAATLTPTPTMSIAPSATKSASPTMGP